MTGQIEVCRIDADVSVAILTQAIFAENPICLRSCFNYGEVATAGFVGSRTVASVSFEVGACAPSWRECPRYPNIHQKQ